MCECKELSTGRGANAVIDIPVFTYLCEPVYLSSFVELIVKSKHGPLTLTTFVVESGSRYAMHISPDMSAYASRSLRTLAKASTLIAPPLAWSTHWVPVWVYVCLCVRVSMCACVSPLI